MQLLKQNFESSFSEFLLEWMSVRMKASMGVKRKLIFFRLIMLRVFLVGQ